MENSLSHIELSALRLKEARSREAIDALRVQSAELEKQVVSSDKALVEKSKSCVGFSNMMLLGITWCLVFITLHAVFAKEAFSVYFLMAGAPGLFTLLHSVIQLRNE